MMKEQTKGNIAGLGAIILWSSSALFVTLTGSIPPFLIGALTGFFCFILYFIRALSLRERLIDVMKLNPKKAGIPLAGIFIYLALYLAAFKQAPAIEVNLLNYLWPLLIVFFGALIFRSHPFRLSDATGMLLGFIGAGLIFSESIHTIGFSSDYIFGYILATLAAIVWAFYSNLTRYSNNEARDMAGVYLASAGLFFLCHLLFEGDTITHFQNMSLGYWMAIFGLTLSNMGYACWDYAMKKGQTILLASLSYMIPLFSTILLLLFHDQPVGKNLAISAALIIVACLVVNAGKIVSLLDRKKANKD